MRSLTPTRKLFLLYLIAINLFQLYQMGDDKQRAVHQQWRIPEAQLLTVNWIGAPVGTLLGMLLNWHKVRRIDFWLHAFGACLVWYLIVRFVFRKRRYLL